MQLLDKISTSSIPYSTHNKYVRDTLIEAKHNRIRVGFINNSIESLNDTYQAYDICKCYRSVLYNPAEDWIQLDWRDEWKPYKKTNKLELGLYYVQTNDTTLFKKSNIYSSAIIEHATKHGIKFKILKQLIPSKRREKEYFKTFIDTILQQYGETQFSKELINILTGMTGKTKNEDISTKINTDIHQVLSHVNNIKDKPYIKNINRKGKPIYMYGNKKIIPLNETCLPIYIQIIDQSNIKLFNMGRQIIKKGGTLVAYKTDCIIARNLPIPTILSLDLSWGSYRNTEVPNITFTEKYHYFKMPSPYWNKYEITDSDDYNKVYEIIKNSSILINGRAGTGKTYLVKKIKAMLEQENKKILTLAPTNKCALSWNGETIHTGLGLTDKTKISSKEKIAKLKKYDYIIIDEISMIPNDIWRILDYVKKSTNIKFILIGDKNQLPPIETMYDTKMYLESQGVKNIADFNKITLTTIKRYDTKLAEIGNDIIENKAVDISQFPYKPNAMRNLCYYNKTRKYINETLNKKYAPSDAILIKNNCKDSEYPQDALIYKGLPIIAYRKDKKFITNSENFTVDSINDKEITMHSIRPDCNGNEMIYSITIKKNKFHKYFLLNYCTTTHKAQGDTIDEDINIYDWDKMNKKLRYTAITRVKNINQIGIVP